MEADKLKKQWFRFRTIRFKLIAVTLLLLAVPALVIGIFSYTSSKASLDELGKTKLKNNVEMALKIIDQLNDEVENGDMTLEEAQAEAKDILIGEKNSDGTREVDKSIDLGENGYLSILNEKGDLIGHQNNEGGNVWNEKDQDGVMLGQEIIKSGLSGGGYSQYKWPLPSDKNVIASKISYSKADSDWNWVVSAGAYLVDFNKSATHILNILLITLGICLVLGAIIIWFFSGYLAKPIVTAAHNLREVAEGNLDIEPININRHDEIGQLATSFNQMHTNLRALISEVVETAEQVAASSEEVNASADQTAKATEHISTSFEQIASGAGEQDALVGNVNSIVTGISAKVMNIKEKVLKTNTSANHTAKQTETGNVAIENVVHQMNTIGSSAGEMGQMIEHLKSKSEQIGEIVNLINNIAEQTNLLALNAAIEAARAGEHGKGFAVVAGEVRKLAEQSTQSTEQIRALIKDIQSSTSKVVGSMKLNEDAIEKGIRLANETGISFKEISSAVGDIITDIEQISGAMTDIDANTKILVESMDHTSEIIQHTSSSTQEVGAATEEQTASMEEISAATRVLAEMAQELQHSSMKFKL